MTSSEGIALASPDYRYERKFVFADQDERSLELLVKLHPAMFSEVYAARYVNNIYFDTESRSYYEDNVEGSAERLKCRVRWYGEMYGEIPKPMLEFKVKRGAVGCKRLLELPPFRWHGQSTQEAIEQLFAASSMPERVATYLKSVRPTIVNRYRRRYFESQDRAFRLTFDTQLTFQQPECCTTVPIAAPSAPGHSIVMELKYAVSEESRAAEVANYLGARITRNSKYIQGMWSIGDY